MKFSWKGLDGPAHIYLEICPEDIHLKQLETGIHYSPFLTMGTMRSREIKWLGQ